ncbi:MAG: ethanolamine utilization protein EutN, partial [Oscillospiraceae bacterium]
MTLELAKVIGSVWCTRKSNALTGNKLLLVEPWKAGEGGGSGSR